MARCTIPRTLFLATLIGLAISACGGGGGEGPAPEPPAPPPPPPPFGFSGVNVAAASRITLDLVEHADDWAQYAVEASDHAAGGLLERFTVNCDADSSGAATFSSMDDNDASDDLTEGDAIHVRLEDCDDTTLSLTSIEASRVIGNMTDHLESGRLQESITGLDYSVEFAGRLESDELDGAFDFETGTAFGGSLGSYPTAGELTLTATNSNGRVTSSSSADLDEHADYQVDSDGTGQYSEAVSVRWLDWISGSLFRWYPLIRGLSILPRNPGKSDRLRAVFRTYAPQGERVSTTYEWSVNGSVQVGHTMDYLPSGNSSKGDVVEVRVTASAGEDSLTRETSVTIRNIPPDVQAMLSPEIPDTRDDIALSYRVGDIDGDEVETNIQWSINGSVVPDLETATLPSDRHRKNDVIRVLVTANDGETETSREVELTIQDAIPDIGLSGVPDSVDYGSRIGFNARVSDADGDDLSTFRFGIDYGPVGMTVDPVTGRVEWPVRLPMFDREMDVRWRIGSANGPAESVLGVFRVVDPDRQYPFMVSGINSANKVGTRIADIDGDGDDDMLLNNRVGHVYTLEWDGQDLRESWAHPFAINTHSGIDALTSGDIDGDGRHEIFLLGSHFHEGDDTLIRLDGVQRQVVASATVPPMIGLGNAIEFADLDNDGSFELVYMADADPHHHSSIVVLSADDLSLLWESPPDYLGGDVKVGNVDDDPALEIVVSGAHVFDGETYEREWSHESAYSADNVLGTSATRGLFVRDMDGDGIDEIIGKLNHDDPDGGIEVYSVAKGRVLGNAEPIPGSLFDARAVSPLVADIDDDGVLEVLGISFPDSSVSAYRYEESTDAFQEVFSQEPNSMFHAPIDVGDLNGDGYEDFLTRSTAYDIVNGNTIWEPQPPHPDASLVHASGGDLDGDGVAEIVLLTSALTNVRRFGSDLELLNSFTIELDYVHDRPDRLFVVPGSGGQEQLLVSFFHDSLAQTSRLIAYDPETGHEIWESPRLFGRVLPNSVHYFDDSGEPRLAIGTSEAMYVTR